MIIYLLVMFIEFMLGKLLTLLFKSNYMYNYINLKNDLINYFIDK